MKDVTMIITAKITDVFRNLPDDVVDVHIKDGSCLAYKRVYEEYVKERLNADDVNVEIQNFVMDVKEK